MRSPGRRGGAAGPAAGTGAGGAGAGFAADAVGADAGTAAALGWAAGAGASVFAGAGAGAAAAAPSESITPTMVWIGTVCPSPTLISLSTPAAGAGISASTLSVEISNSGSSRSTLSPGFFSHLVMVPSKMLSPIWGMTTSIAMGLSPLFPALARRFILQPCATQRDKKFSLHSEAVPRHCRQSVSCQLSCRGRYLCRVRQKMLLERRGERHRRVQRRHAQHRTVQVLESALADDHGDLSGDAAGSRVLVDHQHLVGLLDRKSVV